MHLLYVDESGNPEGAEDRHFVLAGLSAFEQNTYFLAKDVDSIKHKYFPTLPPLDFHVSKIRAGSGFWRNIDRPVREAVLTDLAHALVASAGSVRLFGTVVEKDSTVHGESAIKLAMEQVCKRFDIMLSRRWKEDGDKQRGLLVLAESSYQTRAKVWVQGFRELGTQWGCLRNLSESPFFVPAKESRLIQLADYVAHALFLAYERNDRTLLRPIMHRFDQRTGVLHGLHHASPTKGLACDCPACYSRRHPGQLGPWTTG